MGLRASLRTEQEERKWGTCSVLTARLPSTPQHGGPGTPSQGHSSPQKQVHRGSAGGEAPALQTSNILPLFIKVCWRKENLEKTFFGKKKET